MDVKQSAKLVSLLYITFDDVLLLLQRTKLFLLPRIEESHHRCNSLRIVDERPHDRAEYGRQPGKVGGHYAVGGSASWCYFLSCIK